MSQVSQLIVEIADLLDAGHEPRMVAIMLDIPVDFVHEVEENYQEELFEVKV